MPTQVELSGFRSSVAIQPQQALSANYANAQGFTSRQGRPAITGALTGATQRAAGTLLSVRRKRRKGPPLAVSLAAAAGVGLVGIWFTILPRLYPLSRQALVNAQVSVIDAPIDGVISDVTGSPGRTVHRGAKLCELRNDALDQSRLARLEDRLPALVDERRALQSQAEDAATAAHGAANDAESKNRRLAADRVRAVAEATTLVENLGAIAAKTEVALRAALAAAIPDPAQVDKATVEQALAARATDTQNQRLSELRAEMEANLPDRELLAARTRRDELAAHAATTAEAAQAIDAHVIESEQEVSRERARLDLLRQATVAAPIDGVLWKTPLAAGKQVKAGFELLSIADPRTTMIEAVLSERDADRVAVGERAVVHLIGQHRDVIGTVAQVLRPGEPLADARFADAHTADRMDRLRAVITLPTEIVSTLTIDQGARVMVIGEDPGFIKGMIVWLAKQASF